MYVISITCPVHPGKAAEAKQKAAMATAERKKKAQEAAERKAEKERKEREERERLAALRRAKVREMYAHVVRDEDNSDAKDAANKKRKHSPAKQSGTMDTFVKVHVTSEDLLSHAKTVHEKRTSDIRTSIRKEEVQLMAELRKKHAKEESDLRGKITSKQSELIGNANEDYEDIKSKIEEACDNKRD